MGEEFGAIGHGLGVHIFSRIALVCRVIVPWGGGVVNGWVGDLGDYPRGYLGFNGTNGTDGTDGTRISKAANQ